MLIAFKIRALFIWTDPYLPDLINTGLTIDTAGLVATPTVRFNPDFKAIGHPGRTGKMIGQKRKKRKTLS